MWRFSSSVQIRKLVFTLHGNMDALIPYHHISFYRYTHWCERVGYFYQVVVSTSDRHEYGLRLFYFLKWTTIPGWHRRRTRTIRVLPYEYRYRYKRIFFKKNIWLLFVEFVSKKKGLLWSLSLRSGCQRITHLQNKSCDMDQDRCRCSIQHVHLLQRWHPYQYASSSLSQKSCAAKALTQACEKIGTRFVYVNCLWDPFDARNSAWTKWCKSEYGMLSCATHSSLL